MSRKYFIETFAPIARLYLREMLQSSASAAVSFDMFQCGLLIKRRFYAHGGRGFGHLYEWMLIYYLIWPKGMLS